MSNSSHHYPSHILPLFSYSAYSPGTSQSFCFLTAPPPYQIIKYNQFQVLAAAATAKLLQSCLTLCDPIDSSPPGSVIPGILQARTLEWADISFYIAWKWKVKVKSLSRGWLIATPWTAAYQAPPSMGFSRQEYWSGLPLPSPSRSLITLNLFLCHGHSLHLCLLSQLLWKPHVFPLSSLM